MLNRKIGDFLVAIFFACFAAPDKMAWAQFSDEDIANAAKVDPLEVYAQNCASCHGKNLQGASATPLIKTDWARGGSGLSIALSILRGVEGTDMPAWGGVLTNSEVIALTGYIAQAQSSLPQTASDAPSNIATKDYSLSVKMIAKGDIKTPWGIEFVDAQTALITERPGGIRRMIIDQLTEGAVSGLAQPHVGSMTGGLMDIALDPDYADNGFVYLCMSHSDSEPQDRNAPAMTRIVRGRITDNTWSDQEIMFEAEKDLWVVKGDRWGCRFVFDQDGYLLFTIGDMGQADASQDPGKAVGKIYRIARDGSIPDDNPFLDVEGALPQLYALGARNTQGLDLDRKTGIVWAVDHGPYGGDELNIIRPGANYGWPVTTFGIDYSGAGVSSLTEKEGIEAPLKQWTPSIAVSSLAVVDSPKFEKWRGRLLVGSLGFEELWLLTMDGDQVVGEELIFKNLGRIRDLKFAPDGALYVLLNEPDMILRIEPEA